MILLESLLIQIRMIWQTIVGSISFVSMVVNKSIGEDNQTQMLMEEAKASQYPSQEHS
jgi:hypothetical protein